MLKAIRNLAIVGGALMMSAAGAHAMDHKPSPPPSGGHGGGHGGGSSGSPHSVPEPGVIGLFGLGVAGLWAGRRMSRRGSKRD